MSNVMMTAVFNLDVTPAALKLVLLSIADRANEDGTCWCGKRDITKRTSLDARTVDRAVSALRQKGLLTVEVGTGLHGTNTYKVHPRQDAPPAPRPPASCTIPPGTLPSTPRHPDALTPAPRPPNHIEPLFNPPITSPLPSAGEVVQTDSMKDEAGAKHVTVKTERKRNVAFDALATVCRIDPTRRLTPSEASKIGKALSEISAAMPDVSPENLAIEIQRRAANYRLNKPPGCLLSPPALASNWGESANAKPANEKNGHPAKRTGHYAV